VKLTYGDIYKTEVLQLIFMKICQRTLQMGYM